MDAQEDRIRQLLRDTKMLDKHAMEKVLPPWRFVLDSCLHKVARELKSLEADLKATLSEIQLFGKQHWSAIELEYKSDRAIMDLFFTRLCESTEASVGYAHQIMSECLSEV